jgi:hypothetical protein
VTEHFSICQFFHDGTYEYTRKHVPAQEAVNVFRHYVTNVAAGLGITVRVIITDASDCICREWQYGKGITFENMEQASTLRSTR